MNLPRSPVILHREATNKLSHFLTDTRPPRTSLRDPAPIESKTLAMPTDHRVGLYDDQNVFPAGPESEQCNPESPIERREFGDDRDLKLDFSIPAR
jgi:hypothetical protein